MINVIIKYYLILFKRLLILQIYTFWNIVVVIHLLENINNSRKLEYKNNCNGWVLLKFSILFMLFQNKAKTKSNELPQAIQCDLTIPDDKIKEPTAFNIWIQI